MRRHAFIEALKAGFRGKEAGLIAGYPPSTAGQMASNLMHHPEVLAAFDGNPPRPIPCHLKPKSESLKRQVAASVALHVSSQAPARKSADPPDYSVLGLDATDDPKVFLTQLMNCGVLDPKLRKEAAVALMPFVHKKLGEGGKKEARQAAAEEVGGTGRFAQGRAPLSVVKNS